jgi:hypothetical protein
MSSVRVDSMDTEDSGVSADHPVPEAGDDSTESRRGVVAQAEEYLRQHPLARVAIAFGIGALLQTALKAGMQRLAKGDEIPKGIETLKGAETPKGKIPQKNLSAKPRSARPRTHQFGAADMEFSSHHPDGKNVAFKFAWKKRPIDAPEEDWPIDEMGFTAVRPNGKRTAFTFKGKTRPIPDEKSAVGDSRPGLGEAKMEFTSSAPGRRDFRFTWKRVPPAGGGQDSDQPPEISHIGDGESGAVSAVKRPEKRPAKKAYKKKAYKKKASKKSASVEPGKEKHP